MAVVGNTVATLADHAKKLDPNGKVSRTVEILSQQNEILDDMLFKEGNLPTGEQTTIRTGLPDVYYRLANMGVPSSKSKTAQVIEHAASLEARCELDVDVVNLNANAKQFRFDENIAFLEAMNQRMATSLFYGSASNPEEFVGLANRYGDLSASNAQNIIDAGGTGSDNTSIYLVGWGQRTCHGVFPKGTKAGVSHEDLGIGDAFDANGDRFRAYMDHWKWKNGLVVKDWRYVVRIANIDVSNLVADETGGTVKLINLMLRAIHRIPSLSGVKLAFYANRTVKEMLDIQAANKANVQLRSSEEEGKLKTTLRMIPVRTVDALLETEARVV
ncbi:hypothetical protein LJ739_06765 [Aestuariibacter halophilus]|uniref:Major capsid protein n=1 Tax=Fluctibacter halophilus TaxID=226011 RepID=A0ABS8G612_9ALTE|nr:hypothetical protein [Aestuariibacter halophilus]MCC2615938.1 hypothetical protein [Aestuariibacter halophilus]